MDICASKQKLSRKIIIAVIIAVIIAFCLELLFINNDKFLTESMNNSVTLSAEQLDINQSDQSTEILLNSNNEIKAVNVYFASPLINTTTVDFLNPDTDALYNSVEIASGSMNALCDIYDSGVQNLLIRINEKCEINSVEFSSKHSALVSTGQSINPSRLIISIIILFVIVFCFIYFNIWKRICNIAGLLKQNCISDKKHFIIKSVITGLCIAIPIIICKCILPVSGITVSDAMTGIITLICITICLFTVFFKYTGIKPGWFFLLIFIPIAIMVSALAPSTYSLVGWDEEQHYEWTIQTLYINEDASYTYADNNYISRNYFDSLTTASDTNNYAIDWSLESEAEAMLNADYEKGTEYIEHNNSFSLSKLCYIPNAAGIYIARALNLNFHGQIVMSRIMMVFMYALFVSVAIKLIKSGKMILAVLALIPTCMFLCSTMSPDAWVMAFSILGFALFFRQVQTPEQKLRYIDIALIFGLLFLAFTPKETYAPVILLALLMPKKKFVSSGQRAIYVAACIATVAVLILDTASLVFDIGTPTGIASDLADVRVSDTDFSSQLSFILSNAGYYFNVLINHLKDYLSFATTQLYMVNFAYLGTGYLFEVSLCCILFAAFTGHNNYGRPTLKASFKIYYLIIFAVMTVLISTALYLTYTPVGAGNIDGCQPRYLLPLLFPVLYVVGIPFNNILQKDNIRNIYNTALFALCFLVLLINFCNIIFMQYP